MGLRTLLICRKEMSESAYKRWQRTYETATAAIKDRDARVEAAVAEMERDLELLGATAIEDRLQESVGETIRAVKEAGIGFWMLTGDKIETAVNVGFSCELLGRGTKILRLEAKSKTELMAEIQEALEFLANNEDVELATVLEGEAFFKVQQSTRLTAAFMDLAIQSKAVIGCRLSPKQKSELIRLMKLKCPDETTLAIGDGANDVSMITEASIGIGLVGKEGNQAVSSSDYALSQFSHLKPLLLYHGREAYRRNAYVICYMYYKNLLLNMPIMLYSLVSAFSGQIMYERVLTQTFNVIFTSWPIIFFATWDSEFPRRTLLAHPSLYKDGIAGKHFNAGIFLSWLLYTLAEASWMMVLLYGSVYSAVAVLGDEGQKADIWMEGWLVYVCTVLTVSMRLLMDSHVVNWLIVVFMLFCVGCLVPMTLLASQYQWDELYAGFFGLFSIPTFLFVVCFQLLFPIPLVSLLGWWQRGDQLHQKIEELKAKERRLDRSSGEDDEQPLLDEDRGLQEESMDVGSDTMHQQQPNLQPGKDHTGFAFSGEEGHVPQITGQVQMLQ